MGGEVPGVSYGSSELYHPVDFEGGLLCDMPTEPSSQVRSHPTGVWSRPGPRSSSGFVVVSLRCPPLASSEGWATSHHPLFCGDSFPRGVARRAHTRRLMVQVSVPSHPQNRAGGLRGVGVA